MRVSERDLVALEPARIALAVQPLMVRAGDGGKVLESGDARQDGFGVGRVHLHRLPFLAVELAGLVENGVADAELADVVQQGRALEPAPALGRKPQLFGDHVREQGDALAVAAGVGALGIDHLGEGGGDVVEIIARRRL